MEKLDKLLISQEMADFLRDAKSLVATTDHDRLARWWVFMNRFYWPDGIEDPIPLVFHSDWSDTECQWAQDRVFDLITAAVDAHLLSLHWQAAGNAPPKTVRSARFELMF